MEKYLDSISKAIISLGQYSWMDYAHLVVSIIGIIISAYAIKIAVNVPEKIAQRQDKIALFDKRFAAYEVLEKCVIFANVIEKCQSGVDRKTYIGFFAVAFFNGNTDIVESENSICELQQISAPLKHMTFLFDGISAYETQEISLALIELLYAVTANLQIESSKTKYVTVVKKFFDKHNENILNLLQSNKT